MAPRSFKNLVITVGGTFPNLRQVDLKTLIEGNGATFSTAVTDECTHLVTTEKDVEKQTTKYKQASQVSNCHIVPLSWLLESAEAKKPLPESKYSFGQASQPDDDTQKTADAAPAENKRITRKRGADTAPAETQDTQKNGADSKAKPSEDKKPASKKRSATEDPVKNGSDKKTKDIQKTTKKTINVPVDEGFMEFGKIKDPKVYIDSAGLIWDATLSQTVSANNANKFYRIQLLSGTNSKYFTWTRWGRVGEHGQSACLGEGSLGAAMKHYEKKFRDKSGLKWVDRLDTPKNGKYTFLERNYEEDDEDEEPVKKEKTIKEEEDQPEVESALSKGLQNLMSFIFNKQDALDTLAAMSYDVHKLPLGKLSDRTLKSGFSALKEISELMITPSVAQAKYGQSYNDAIETLSNRYFTLIPHVFGRHRPPTLNTNAQIKKEIDLLEALTDMDVANEIMVSSKQGDDTHALDRQFQSLGMKEMTELDHKSTEFVELENYLKNSRGDTHNMSYKVVNIFRIERQGENDRFNTSPYASIPNSDRRLLWHGSRSTNFGGILSQGLRIAPPEAPVNGYMFGKGVYLADTSSKSANYCCAYNSRGMGLLLLCDAELGAPMLELVDSNYNAGEDARNSGKIATLGKGLNVPGGWKDAGCLNPALEGVKMPDVAIGSTHLSENRGLFYNEYIVYDVAQIRQRYLFQVKMN
ncbi:hypothetical protein DTO027I6_8828 [Penicillium roqueforti]|nr:hypothetical protein CBS147337_8622 [Penicillium roqueforti]KAI2683983.1 hypothetical protein LCP963914a_5813 [Penicillium roqueforti]KAI3131212.1 hypothetical protein CBS147326_5817 [Penicillium roqueforti]KAI3189263.1 hypothetical protein DTO027I6_8828 [Penicillium roqueforti]KAI3198598.1 hypothetical protein CBS147311_6277 [Penicillium roqueforti]